MTVEVVVLAGPAGVGKTSVANELSLQLRSDGAAHAVIDTDALDDVFPVPENQWELTERHLACVWRSYRELGIRRLILTGVYLHHPRELEWIARATAPDRVELIRLDATDSTLADRVRRREIGSAFESQISRTRTQTQRIRGADDGATVVPTDDRSVIAIAAEIRELIGWR